MKASMKRVLAVAVTLLLTSAAPALAHLNPAEHGSLAAGFSHPLSGLDHILVMVAVGLWAAMIGGRVIWMVPAAFVGSMAVGFALALLSAGLPFVEPAIAASVVALGLLVAAAVKLPASMGMAIVGLFALFHGHAHGSETGTATMVDYGFGFATATALLHVVGIGLGLAIGSGRLLPERIGGIMVRVLGGIAALLGVGLAVGLV